MLQFESPKITDFEGHTILMKITGNDMPTVLFIEEKFDHFIMTMNTMFINENHNGVHKIRVELNDDGPDPKFPSFDVFEIKINYELPPVEVVEIVEEVLVAVDELIDINTDDLV